MFGCLPAVLFSMSQCMPFDTTVYAFLNCQMFAQLALGWILLIDMDRWHLDLTTSNYLHTLLQDRNLNDVTASCNSDAPISPCMQLDYCMYRMHAWCIYGFILSDGLPVWMVIT